jgi:RNA polymerase sigma factor (sigma-70 family)
MVNEEGTSVIARVRKLADAHMADREDDARLIDRFVRQQDQTAFEALMRRHGPMVLRVCERILGQAQDAEDAFQATFLVFCRKAASLRDRRGVGSWLFGVASRVARKARVASRRRVAHEAHAAPRNSSADPPAPSIEDAQALLDEQLALLPEAYRSVLILCYVQGLTRDQVAEQLRLSLAGVKKRLERGRELLRNRLARRGVRLSAALFGTLLAGEGMAAVPPALATATVRNSLALASGQSQAPAGAMELYRGVLRTMYLTKLKVIGVTAMILLGIALSIGFGYEAVSAKPPVAASPTQVAPIVLVPVAAPVPKDANKSDTAKRGRTVPAGIPLDARLVGKTAFTLDLHGMTAEQFRDRLKPAPVLPGMTQVDLRLEVTNTGEKPLKLQVGGATNYLTLDLQGPGVVIVPALVRRPQFGKPATPPKEVTVEPGKTVTLLELPRLTFNSPKGVRMAYWTEAGEFTLEADYQVAVSPAPAGTEANADGFAPVSLLTPKFQFKVEAPAEKK